MDSDKKIEKRCKISSDSIMLEGCTQLFSQELKLIRILLHARIRTVNIGHMGTERSQRKKRQGNSSKYFVHLKYIQGVQWNINIGDYGNCTSFCTRKEIPVS